MKCTQGIVFDGVVPAITYCRLSLKDGYDNSRKNLGQYINGFWFQDETFRKPFLRQSFVGEYRSVQLDGK